MTATAHNAKRGYALAIAVMDHVRACAAQGGEVSMWNLGKAMADKFGETDADAKLQLYDRVRTTVDTLENAALITTEKRWNGDKYIKFITACSEQSS